MAIYYPGDTKTLVLSIIKADGTAPNVTVAPTVAVVQLSSGSTVLAATSMTLIAGTQAVYIYRWATTGMSNGDYASIVSYAADGITVNGRLLEVFHIGDTMISGAVALDATVAKDSTVAKDATVAHQGDLAAMSPDNSPIVLSIKLKTDNLPADPVSAATLESTIDNVQDLHDYQLGTWTIDKTQVPNILTILSPSSQVVARFALSDNISTTQRSPQ